MNDLLRSLAAWLLLGVIVLGMLPYVLLMALFETRIDPNRERFRRRVAKAVALYGRTSPLYDFEIEDRDRLPNRGPYLIVAHHESGLDLVGLCMLGTGARFLAAGWLFRAWWSGWFLRLCRHIPVRRRDPESRKRALDEIENALKKGMSVIVFPEGQYSEGKLATFHPGAFVAAARAAAPIVPVRIEGTGQAWKPGTFVVDGRHPIRVRVMPSLLPESENEADVSTLIQRARAVLAPED